MIGLRKEIVCRACHDRTDYDRFYEIESLIEHPTDLLQFDREAVDYFKNVGWQYISNRWLCPVHTNPHSQISSPKSRQEVAA